MPGGSNGDLNGVSFALSLSDIAALRQGHPLFRCLNVLNHVMQQPAAAPFCSQVHRLSSTQGTECLCLQQKPQEPYHCFMSHNRGHNEGRYVEGYLQPCWVPLG